MKKKPFTKKLLSADTIARMADSGKDVSRYFSNSGKMMKPLQHARSSPTLVR
jgi:hypothetical protein